MSNLVYPHTDIINGLSTLAEQLISMQQFDMAKKARAALEQYLQKKTFYTDRIAELENAQNNSHTKAVAAVPYPHTRVQADIATLRDSLEESGSPERETRLELLDTIESEYMKKRAWFTQFS